MYETFEIAVKHTVDVADTEFRPVIFDQPVGSEHVAADLAAEVDVELRVFQLALFFLLLFKLELDTAGRAVASSRWRGSCAASVRSGTGRRFRSAGVSSELPIPFGSRAVRLRRWPENIDPKIVRLDIDLDLIVDLGINEHRGE